MLESQCAASAVGTASASALTGPDSKARLEVEAMRACQCASALPQLRVGRADRAKAEARRGSAPLRTDTGRAECAAPGSASQAYARRGALVLAHRTPHACACDALVRSRWQQSRELSILALANWANASLRAAASVRASSSSGSRIRVSRQILGGSSTLRCLGGGRGYTGAPLGRGQPTSALVAAARRWCQGAAEV